MKDISTAFKYQFEIMTDNDVKI